MLLKLKLQMLRLKKEDFSPSGKGKIPRPEPPSPPENKHGKELRSQEKLALKLPKEKKDNPSKLSNLS